MNNERELQNAIDEYLSAELTPQRSIKLASYITVLNHIQHNSEKKLKTSQAVKTGLNGTVADEINNKNSEDIWAIIIELLETLQITNPPLFNATMRKIKSL